MGSTDRQFGEKLSGKGEKGPSPRSGTIHDFPEERSELDALSGKRKKRRASRREYRGTERPF